MNITLDFINPSHDQVVEYLKENNWITWTGFETHIKFKHPTRDFFVNVRFDDNATNESWEYLLKQINYDQNQSLLELWAKIQKVSPEDLYQGYPLGVFLEQADEEMED